MIPNRALKIARRVAAWQRRGQRRHIEPHGAVLMYHRVGVSQVDPWHLCVAPGRFASQVRALGAFADVVPLEGLYDALRKSRGSRPVVALTFDDGYLDNLTEGAPVLREFRVPATVFVATDYVGTSSAYWWDALAHCVLTATAVPGALHLEAAGSEFAWTPRRLELSRDERHELHSKLWQWLSLLSPAHRHAALAEIERWTNVAPPQDDAARPMGEDELRALASGGLVTIGAHTASHCRLSKLDSPTKKLEIESSREACRRITGRTPHCFAYPNGDLDAESVGLTRELGFSVAVTSEPDLAWASSDRLATPRIAVKNWSERELIGRLRWYWRV
jgi:peptidoglycan/xylan/chitin deacetylase (PgdA/CDA1 family)